jgi:hypothetical protein
MDPDFRRDDEVVGRWAFRSGGNVGGRWQALRRARASRRRLRLCERPAQSRAVLPNPSVIPAEAGIHCRNVAMEPRRSVEWIPTFVGMTKWWGLGFRSGGNIGGRWRALRQAEGEPARVASLRMSRSVASRPPKLIRHPGGGRDPLPQRSDGAATERRMDPDFCRDDEAVERWVVRSGGNIGGRWRALRRARASRRRLRPCECPAESRAFLPNPSVIPAEAGIHCRSVAMEPRRSVEWIPTFVGMTK